jgi:acetolactate synthase I/II/III large subunit
VVQRKSDAVQDTGGNCFLLNHQPFSGQIKMEMKVADVIVKCLEAEGIEYAFGITGYHYLALYKALKNSSIKYISVKHESAAGFMAAHYARISQKPALIMGTAGPGAMNLLNGITELYKANLPAFILTPMAATELQGKNAAQEDSGIGNSYSIAEIMKCITKQSIFCIHPHNISLYVQDLLRYMMCGRKGPVHLLIASNFFETVINFTPLSPQQYRTTNEEQIEPNKIKNIAKELVHSKRPLLFLGHRAWFPDTTIAINKLSNTFGIPVILSSAAKGLYNEYSPFFGGIFDLYGHRSAEVFVKKSDLIISIGQDFGEYATNKYEPGIFENKLIQLDVDGYDIGRNYQVNISSYGNLNAIIERLIEELNLLGTKPFFNDSFAQEFNAENVTLWQDMEDSTLPLRLPRIFKEISDLLPEKSIVINDIGTNGFSSLRHLRVHLKSYSILMCGYSMGQGVSGCIGAKLASPESIIISICGDGALLMNGMEIATACQNKISIIWIVFVDNRYGMVDFGQKLLYNDLEYCTDLFVPELSKFAESFSIDYYKANDVPSLHKGFSNAIINYSSGKSTLIEINFNTDDPLPIKPRSIKNIQEVGNVQEAGKSPYLMKAFKRMLREKV